MRIHSTLMATAAAALLSSAPARAADILESEAPPVAAPCNCAPVRAAVPARVLLAVPAAVVVPDPVRPVGPAVVYGPPIQPSYIVDQGPSYTVPAVPYVSPSVYQDGGRDYGYVGRAALAPAYDDGVRYGVSYGSGYGGDYGYGYGYGAGYAAPYAFGPRYGHYGYRSRGLWRGAAVGYGYRGYGRSAALGWARPAYRGYPGVAFHQPRHAGVRIVNGGFRAGGSFHGHAGGFRGGFGGGRHR